MGIPIKCFKLFANTVSNILNKLPQKKSIMAKILLTKDLPMISKVNTPAGELSFLTSSELLLWRIESILTKEPETIDWINSFDKDSVFWDIGANIGLFSIYAAKKANCKTLSFEPSAFNYNILNRNIELNHLDEKILAICFALSDNTSLSSFYLSNTEDGSACHGFEEAKDQDGNNFNPEFNQGMLGMSIDKFIETFNPPFPQHIKIDVDGIEDKIVYGAKKTFADPRLKSVLIELEVDQEEKCKKMIEFFESSGLKLVAQKHSSAFESGRHQNIYNHIFERQ
jgi:FkbM family methyltransferase